MNQPRHLRLAILAAMWAALVLAPYWTPLFGGYTALGSRVLVLGLGAMALNFLLGFTGVLSFGHAAWFGLGAYACGLTLKFIAASTPLGLCFGTLVGGIAGAVLGALLVRRRGIYFAMITIAFGQVFYYIAFQWLSVTGGDDGLRGFQREPLDFKWFQIDLLHNDLYFYYFVLISFAAVVAIMAFVLHSPFGRTMIAIRENERRARFLGIAVELHIWIAFTLSCFFMAFAGALYALLNNFADPRVLHYSLSGDFVIMAVMGGMRTFWGPLLGAVIFVVLQDYISSVTVNWMSFIGLLIVLLAERKLHRGRQLSGGEQEMLAIARALLLNPKLLILDEPSQGLAPLITREVFRIVAQMRTEGISVLLVEQNVRMSLEIADQAYVLDDGHIVYFGPASELAADEARVQSLAGASAEEWAPQ